MANGWFNVGKIVNTHGIRGELKILSQTDFPEERFKPGNKLFLMNPDETEKLEAVIETARVHKNSYIVLFKGWDDINKVEKYKGWSVKVGEDQLFELPPDEFYYFEIVGCTVMSEEGQEIGKVTEILTPGANDVWVVQPSKGKPVYIPYIDDVVKQVDVENKRITIHLLEGLI